MRTLGTAIAAIVTVLALAGPVAAQTPQPVEFKVTVQAEPVMGSLADHVLTFSAPVDLPQVGLAPGTYVFRILAPSVMQVLNKDRSIVYATFFTLPVWRTEVTSAYDVSLVKVDDRSPLRFVKMFEPNRQAGYEVLYGEAPADTER